MYSLIIVTKLYTTYVLIENEMFVIEKFDESCDWNGPTSLVCNVMLYQNVLQDSLFGRTVIVQKECLFYINKIHFHQFASML